MIYHKYIPKMELTVPFWAGGCMKKWSRLRESNPGPLLYESIALPAELRRQEAILFYSKNCRCAI